MFTVRCEPNILTTNQFNFHLSRVNALNMGKFLIFIYGALDGPLFIIEQGDVQSATLLCILRGFPVQIAVVAVSSSLVYTMCPDGLQFITTFFCNNNNNNKTMRQDKRLKVKKL